MWQSKEKCYIYVALLKTVTKNYFEYVCLALESILIVTANYW